MNEDKKQVPSNPEGETKENKEKTPSAPVDGQVKEKQEVPKQEIPESLRGKDTTELVKMYGELEKKLGEHSSELNQARQLKADMSTILQAVYSDPTLTNQVKEQIRKVSGIESKEDPKKENKETSPVKADTETRRVLEGQIVREFENQYGLTNLSPEKRQEVYQKIGTELIDLVDPGGNLTLPEVISSINLEKLPKYLANAFKLANLDGDIEKATSEAQLKARKNAQGVIGSIPSSGSVSEELEMTPEERETAKRLGITEEKYLKNKKDLSEATRNVRR